MKLPPHLQAMSHVDSPQSYKTGSGPPPTQQSTTSGPRHSLSKMNPLVPVSIDGSTPPVSSQKRRSHSGEQQREKTPSPSVHLGGTSPFFPGFLLDEQFQQQQQQQYQRSNSFKDSGVPNQVNYSFPNHQYRNTADPSLPPGATATPRQSINSLSTRDHQQSTPDAGMMGMMPPPAGYPNYSQHPPTPSSSYAGGGEGGHMSRSPYTPAPFLPGMYAGHTPTATMTTNTTSTGPDRKSVV